VAADRRLPLNARLRYLLAGRQQPQGCRQQPWTLTDRLIIRLLAWRRYAPAGRGPHLIWN